MKKFFLALMLVCGLSYAQTTAPVVQHTFYDDTYVHVPLQFGFPFYGRTFTNSWMHSNGVVSFLDPAVPIPNAAYNPASWAFCCEGIPPTTTAPQFSYMIAPLWTDLYPVAVSRFSTQGDATFQRYRWENIAEISNMNNLNTFSLEIRPTGYIGVQYELINIQNQNTWVGTIGDPALGQWNQIYYGRGIPTGALTNWSVNNTPGDLCMSNPLSSPTCAGYTEAMCSTNPLYSPTCPGYATAYLTQQCSSNPLFDPLCPGYATAYLNYQCSINPLYSTTCEGYANAYFNQQCSENPLYNSRCPGYNEAYHEQQCSINPLYSTTCTGYLAAYFNHQCSLNPLYNNQCPGYGQAYFNQQCSINPLYNSNCSGYTEAYKSQQCSLNGLYAADCPNYAQAYFNQQCSLNGLYDTRCPNYSTAYATKQALEASKPAIVTGTPTQTVAAATTTSTPSAVTVIADPVVNSVVTSTATSASPAQSATAVVPLVQTVAPTTSVATAAPAPEERKSATTSNVSTNTASQSTSSETKSAAPTPRQELQARREAAAKAKAVEDGKNLASTMGKVADMETQKQVQNVVLQAMAFTPGFDAYSIAKVPDGVGYKPFTVYDRQVNVDNRRLGMGLYGPSDRLHNQLVDSQYKGN